MTAIHSESAKFWVLCKKFFYYFPPTIFMENDIIMHKTENFSSRFPNTFVVCLKDVIPTIGVVNDNKFMIYSYCAADILCQCIVQ